MILFQRQTWLLRSRGSSIFTDQESKVFHHKKEVKSGPPFCIFANKNDMSNYKDFIESEKARCVIFNIFSALFCQPDKVIISDSLVYEKLEQAIQSLNLSTDLVKQLKPAADKYSETDLLVEYARLFIGPFKTIAPPYSSVYLGSKESVYSEETVWVVKFYRSAGLDFNKEIHDLPDHIAIELEFIYNLIFNEISEMEEENIEKARFNNHHQTRFIKEHFNKWIPLFCDTVISETKNEYYKLLANSMKFFSENDNVPSFPHGNPPDDL